MIGGYVARCAARAEVPAGACAADREWNLGEDGVYCRAIADGTLAKIRYASAWVLFLEWNDGYGQRLLTRGTREQVERHALDVAMHGPVGGPELVDQGTGWRRVGDDDTLRALAPGGELRLMPLFGGQHLLLFSGNESGLSVLGLGEAAELQRTAGELLTHFRGRALQMGMGGTRVPVRAIGAAAVLGCVEMFDGARLLLGHLEGEHFGLFYVRGSRGECVRLYDLDSLLRGDLGQVIEWMHRDRGPGEGQGRVDGGVERGMRAHAEPKEDAAPTSADVVGPSVVEIERIERHLTPEGRPTGTSEDVGVGLTVAEVEWMDRHLAPDVSVAGPGATVVPRLLAGIRGLVRLKLGNLLLRGCDLLALMKTRAGVEVHCCSKTLRRALAWIAARTPLVRAVGRRWLIRFGDLRSGDSELRGWVAEVMPAKEETASDSGPGPAKIVEGLVGKGEARDDKPRQAATEGLRAAGASPGENGVSGGPERELVEQWLRVRQEHRLRFPQERLRRVTMVSLPDEESASRWQPRKRMRDPP